MKIEHVALWTNQLEVLKSFYERYFNAISNEKYVNVVKAFESYFLTFTDGARLEIMTKPTLKTVIPEKDFIGLHHLAFSTGSKEDVDALTKKLAEDGYTIISYPRSTGDGYYESSIKDPDGNIVEITV